MLLATRTLETPITFIETADSQYIKSACFAVLLLCCCAVVLLVLLVLTSMPAYGGIDGYTIMCTTYVTEHLSSFSFSLM